MAFTKGDLVRWRTYYGNHLLTGTVTGICKDRRITILLDNPRRSSRFIHVKAETLELVIAGVNGRARDVYDDLADLGKAGETA